jgi:hypothetical protein
LDAANATQIQRCHTAQFAKQAIPGDELGEHRQVIGDLRNESPDAGFQAAFSSRVMALTR